jgi:hypothetical protein
MRYVRPARILGAHQLLTAFVGAGREDRRQCAEAFGRHALEQRQAAQDVRQVRGRHWNLVIVVRHAYLSRVRGGLSSRKV